MERIFDFRRADPDIVVVIGAPERMHAVGAQRHLRGGFGGRPAQCRLERNRAAFDAGLVADLDVPARHAGIAAHRAPVVFGGLVILQHRLEHERRQFAGFRIGTPTDALEVIVGNFNGRFGH